MGLTGETGKYSRPFILFLGWGWLVFSACLYLWQFDRMAILIVRAIWGE